MAVLYKKYEAAFIFPKTKGGDDNEINISGKPSVAQSITKIISATKRHDGYCFLRLIHSMIVFFAIQ